MYRSTSSFRQQAPIQRPVVVRRAPAAAASPVPAPQLVVPVRGNTSTVVVSRGPGGRTTAYRVSQTATASPHRHRARSSWQRQVLNSEPVLPRREPSMASPPMSRQSSATLEDQTRRSRRPDRRNVAPFDLRAAGVRSVGGHLHRAAPPVFVNHVPPPAPECSVCAIDVPVGGVGLKCPAALHTLCLECATNMARAACDKGERAVCGFCTASAGISARVFSTSQLARAGIPSEVVTTYRTVERRAELTASGGIVARCPTARCGAIHEVERTRTEQPVTCRVCDNAPFCPRCGVQPFHYGATCTDFRNAKTQMPMLVALARGDRKRADAEWEVVNRNEKAMAKDSSTRCCPHCRAPFIRISGCNSMACGNPGCRRGFDYTNASRYESQAPERPTAAFDNNDRGVQPMFTVCAGCGMAPIRGTRFQCMNCPDELSMCRRCFVDNHKAHGDGSHVFVAVVAPAVVAENERRERRRREKAEGGCCIVC